jgi:biotin transport system substrate-specific component
LTIVALRFIISKNYHTEGVFLMKSSIRDICFIGISVAIIAVCARIRIPFPGGVAFTMQTWAVSLAGVVLGVRRGVVAVIVYILLGAVGVPVFTGVVGGIGVIAGLTGGFIVTFPAMAFLAGVCKDNTFYLSVALILGTFINLTGGMLWFAWVSDGTVGAAFSAAVMPFILPEFFKIVAVIIVGRSIQLALAKARIFV